MSQETSSVLESIMLPDSHEDDLPSVKINNKQAFLDEAGESFKRLAIFAKFFPKEKSAFPADQKQLGTLSVEPKQPH